MWALALRLDQRELSSLASLPAVRAATEWHTYRPAPGCGKRRGGAGPSGLFEPFRTSARPVASAPAAIFALWPPCRRACPTVADRRRLPAEGIRGVLTALELRAELVGHPVAAADPHVVVGERVLDEAFERLEARRLAGELR